MLIKTYKNNYLNEDPEYTVQYGSLAVYQQNSVFLKNACSFLNDTTEDFLLISKSNYTIGAIEVNKNTFIFYPSKFACSLSVINLFELLILYIKNTFTNDFVFSLVTNNTTLSTKISFYLENSNNLLYNLTLKDFKQFKLENLDSKYDMVLWT